MADDETDVIMMPASEVRPDLADVQVLAGQLEHRLGRGVRVISPAERPEGRVAVTWWEVIHVWLPAGLVVGGTAALNAFIQEFVGIFGEWARARMRRGEDQQQQPPPQHASLYGPDGKILKTITLKNPRGEPEVEDPDEPPARLPPPGSN